MHYRTILPLCGLLGGGLFAIAAVPALAAPPAPARPAKAPVLVGILDTVRLYHVRSDYPFLASKVLPGVATAKHLTLVVTKSGLLLSPGVPTVDITDDVAAALRADPAVAALPPPTDTGAAASDPAYSAPIAPSGPALVTLTVTRKGFHAATLIGEDVKSNFLISCQFTNATAKAIASLDGTLEFDTLQGAPVQTAHIALSLAIGPHKSVNWDGTMAYNDLIDEDRTLRNTDLSRLQVKFLSVSVIYADGTHSP